MEAQEPAASFERGPRKTETSATGSRAAATRSSAISLSAAASRWGWWWWGWTLVAQQDVALHYRGTPVLRRNAAASPAARAAQWRGP